MSRVQETPNRDEMIVMLDTPQPLETCAKELGCEVEQLFTPLTRRNPQHPEKRFAIDNEIGRAHV